eukprot:438374_1
MKKRWLLWITYSFVAILVLFYININFNYISRETHPYDIIIYTSHENMEYWMKYLNFTENRIFNVSKYNGCGRLWLYDMTGLILTIYNITNDTVYIKNINHNNDKNCNTSKIKIYVTIQGIEYFGGLAYGSNIKCEWYFNFKISISSIYNIKARLLYYNGDVEFNYNLCENKQDYLLWNDETSSLNDTRGIYTDTTYIYKQIGHEKFYASNEQCCEWCSRNSKYCKYFLSNDGNILENRCIMFNNDAKINDTMQLIPVSSVSTNKFKYRTKWIFGKSRQEITKYYLGSLLTATPTLQHCQRKNFDLLYNSFSLDGNVYLYHDQIDE